MATVHVPPQLRELTGGEVTVEIDADTMRDVVTELDVRFPGFAARIVQDGRVAPGLAFSIDHVVTSRGLLAHVKEESVVHIVPGITGG